MSPPDDLVHRAQQGDRDAFSELVRAHQAGLRALVALSVANREAVLDIVQDSFVDAWRGLPGFDRERDFLPWLRAICRNRVSRYFREHARSRERSLVDAALLALPPLDEHADDLLEARVQALRECMTRLHERHRELIDLRFFQEWTVSRIATHIGKSSNAISMLLMRIKDELSACAERTAQRRQP